MALARTTLAALLALATLLIWVPGEPVLRAIQCGILLLAAREALRPGPWPPRHWLAALAALPLWGALQAAAGTAVYAHATWSKALDWAVLAAVFALAFRACVDGVWDRALRWGAAFAIAVAIFSTVQNFTSGGRYFWLIDSGQPEVFGPFQSKNNFASFIVLWLPAALYRGLRGGPAGWPWLAGAAAMAASVVASGSRAGAALVAFELPLVLLLARRRADITGPAFRRTAAGTAVLLAVLAPVAGWETLARKLRAADPMLYRREMMLAGIEMARTRPLTGFGLGNFPHAYPAFARFDSGHFVNHAHNDWIEWAAEGGLPFLLLAAAPAAALLPAAAGSVWGLGVAGVFAHALVDYPMQRLGVAGWVMFLAGALLASRQPRWLSP